ncbi:Type IV pilus biogenesis protein PilP [Caballeronia glathei]|uniref:Pilus assembly protein n=1 Tax=Caballeronia glathei TaxID=60547 RepID=A0A069PRP1_9BURK|nr:type 4a pilus biogenesis protein PilO [Caballeronia glathei]KDR39966.1 hypothetical protein BG61_28120 [Caballeronia glathei]CDY75792.1 Type IV pilus biogenesis protein PilP [Caballeronia glathei]
MNALALNHRSLKRLATQPVDAWSRRRTLLTALAFGALVCALGAQVWRASGVSGLDASRSALADAQHRADRARATAAALPALRARSVSGKEMSDRWTSADALQAITALAAQSGLRVGGIEPVVAKGAGMDAGRGLKFRAEGSFGEIRRFLDALAGLPRLVVPDSVQLKRGADSLTVDSTLRVFEHLPALARADEVRRDRAIVDPFGKKDTSAIGAAGEIQLVGTLVGRRRAMALVETAEGIDGFEPGQQIGGERLGRVHPRSIDLARDDGAARTLALAEDRP